MANYKFRRVENPKLLLPILKERHPQSCFIYNQVIFSEKFQDDLKFYTLTSKFNSDTWVVADYARSDYSHNISISAPNSIIREGKPIPPEIKECVASTDIINWDEGMIFIAQEKPVSAMIFDISCNMKGNVTEAHPCYLFYVDNADAREIKIMETPGAEVHRLDPDEGSEYIQKTWEYATKDSRDATRKCIKANASAGVFVDGKCASSVIIWGDGIMHCLYTDKEYRNRGFGKVTMQYVYKESAKDGCIPCSTVEIKNPRSIGFHKSLGVKTASIVDHVFVKKINID